MAVAERPGRAGQTQADEPAMDSPASERASWQKMTTHLQREVQRLVDVVTAVQQEFRAATTRADAGAMLAARRRYLSGQAELTEARNALAVADASLRLEQAQERLATHEHQVLTVLADADVWLVREQAARARAEELPAAHPERAARVVEWRVIQATLGDTRMLSYTAQRAGPGLRDAVRDAQAGVETVIAQVMQRLR